MLLLVSGYDKGITCFVGLSFDPHVFIQGIYFNLVLEQHIDKGFVSILIIVVSKNVAFDF